MDDNATAATADQGKADSGTGGLLRSLALFVVAAWILRSLIVAPFSIPSGSMLPTMDIGDYLFVQKWPYGYSRYSFPLQIPSFDGRIFGSAPRRGDVVIFRPPGQENVDFVKRVIGLPGDLIAVQAGNVIINGQPVPRRSAGLLPIAISANSPCRVVPGAVQRIRPNPAGGEDCLYPAYRETLPGGRTYLTLDQVYQPRADDVAPTLIPPGHLFLMGDNRDDSLDSRFSPDEGGVGLVPIENVVGRASARFWSTDGSASYLKPWTWFTALRTSRIGGSFNQ